MANDITVNTYLNPANMGQTYAVTILPNALSKRLYADMLGLIIDEVSKKVMEDHGQAMLIDVIKNYDSLRESILRSVTMNIDSLVVNLNELRKAFDYKQCKCLHGLTHADGTTDHRHPSFIQKPEPMTNLEYMEKRQELLSVWVKDLPLETLTAQENRDTL